VEPHKGTGRTGIAGPPPTFDYSTFENGDRCCWPVAPIRVRGG